MDPILIQILIWIWSWSRSRFGSATSSFVSPRPIFIEALAGEMPWREVRASGVKARQHLFCCSQLLTASDAVTLHFGLWPNLQVSIYFCLNIFSNTSLPQYISQCANAVTLHFRLSSNLQVSIYFSKGDCGQIISVYTNSLPITACGKSVSELPITAMWHISVRIVQIFFLSLSQWIWSCVSGSSSHM